MSVIDGQDVNAAVTNAAFMSRNSDTSTTGVVSLENADSPTVDDLQQTANNLFEVIGMTDEDDTTPNFTSAETINTTDSLRVAVSKIDEKFNETTGHDHSGLSNGKPISAANLANFNNFSAEFQTLTYAGASGTSTDVSATSLVAKTSGGSTSSAGVITDAPSNRVMIIESGTETFIEDDDGQRVYGRLTESAGVWTLSYYTNEAGVETAHSLASTDIRAFFLEVFTAETKPTIPSNPTLFGTLDVTADVVDASDTRRGLMSTGTQSFSGVKTFGSNVEIDGDLILVNNIKNLDDGYGILSADRKLHKASDGTSILDFEGPDLIGDGIAKITNIANPTLAQDVSTKAYVDAHIADTANPHAVTKTQVGLSNVTNDAQLKRAAADFNSFTEKTTVVDDDIVLIEDSADSYNKKKVKMVNIGAGGGGSSTDIDARLLALLF